MKKNLNNLSQKIKDCLKTQNGSIVVSQSKNVYTHRQIINIKVTKKGYNIYFNDFYIGYKKTREQAILYLRKFEILAYGYSHYNEKGDYYPNKEFKV